MKAVGRKGGRAVKGVAAAVLLLTALPPYRLTAQQHPDRTNPPALGPAPTMRVPTPVVSHLRNGLELVTVPMHEVPLVDVTVLIGAGGLRDTESEPGLASFTAGMLQQGAGSRSALDIADQAAYLGASLSSSASNDWATVTLHVPRRQLDSALDLMADVIRRPTFSDSEIARQRELRRTGLLQLRDQPTAQAPIAFNAIVYGAHHPYGWPLGGTETATSSLDRAKVQRFYDTWYRPNNAKILVVGDIEPAEAYRLIDARFGNWERGTIAAVPHATAPAPSTRTIYLVDKPGAAQSVIRIGQVGVARSTPDVYAIRVMNTILGGSFTSRLNQNLRETHGYTYGANSGFAMRRMAGPFVAQASVVTAKTDSSLIEFMKELRRIRDEPVPAAEVAKAKSYLILGLPSDFETTQGTAGQFLELLSNDLPLTTWSTYMAHIQAVTPEDVQRVAKRYIDPDHLAIVVVGDRSQIEPGIRALNEGPISLRDLWGQEVH